MDIKAVERIEKTWKQYEKAEDFKNSQKLYEKCARNEKFYASEQWDGVKSNGLPTPVFNFLEQIVDVKVSTIMSQQITIHRQVSEDSLENSAIKTIAKAFSKMDKVNWERTKMKSMNERLLLDAAISGLGVSYWFWDNSIITGNEYVTKGDFTGELIDSVSLSVSNPTEIDIQKQEYIILDMAKTVSEVKKIAKEQGLPEEDIESIKPDSYKKVEEYEKLDEYRNPSYYENNNGLVTVLLKMYKKNGTVHFTKSTKDLELREETDTGLTRYPVAIMPWKLRKNYIYANSELTGIIKNQEYVNKMEAMRQLHTMLMSMPKLLFDKSRIRGVTNQIGGTYGVEGGDIDVRKAMGYVQPAQMSIDVDKAIADVIQLTREFKGVNENLLGISRPENTSALLLQQQASVVPLETIKRRFYRYLEDVALIWLDFYKHKYNMERKVLSEDEKEYYTFVGTDYENVYLKTSIDIGADTQFSELAAIEVLDKLLEGGHITIVQYLQRYPSNVIPDQEDLIEELGGEGDLDRQFKFEMMARVLDQLDEETRARIMNMPEEMREEAIMELALSMEQEQPPQGENVSLNRARPQQASQKEQAQYSQNSQSQEGILNR